MTHSPLKTLNIIGAGRLGRALGGAFHRAEVFQIHDVQSVDGANARGAVAQIGAGRGCGVGEPLRPADVWMITTPDSCIAEACQRIAPLLRGGEVVFHCSGATSSEALGAARATGAVCASVHPANTFTGVKERDERVFPSLPVVAEGDEAALTLLQGAFQQLGAEWHRCDTAHKVRYHLALVLASNYLHTLEEFAARLIEGCGLNRSLLTPIIEQTVRNFLQLGASQALTGPVIRGDLETVERHLNAFTPDEAPLKQCYLALAHLTHQLAPDLPPETTADLTHLLNKHRP